MAWTNTGRRAKITGLRFHDLRRECCPRLLKSGASLHVVCDWAGHANISTTSRYLVGQAPKASTPVAVHPTVQ